MKVYNKIIIDIESGKKLESDSYEYDGPVALANPSGGGGGGGSNDAHITQTTTNPVVPDEMKALADAMNAIATGGMGAPVNFGSIPGLDAPKSGPLIPNPSMGAMFSSTPFNMGYNRMRVNGSNMMPRRGIGTMSRPMPTSWGSLFSGLPSSGAGMPIAKPPVTSPMFNMTVPQPSQNRLATMAQASA